MKIATILIAGLVLTAPGLAQAQTAGPSAAKPTRSDVVKVPRGSAAPAARNGDTDRVIDDELKRIDHMMTICNGC